jgi:glycosyltransferase involved in cell wall biosynthesis
VSVVMPVLDAEEHLREAVDSILAQTYPDLELIIVDDGSSDASPDIIADYARADPRVRTRRLSPDPASNSCARPANAGISLARGAWIARMDADDIAAPDRIEVTLQHMAEHDLDACGGQADAFGARERHYWFPETGEAIRRELIFRVGILHPTLVARAELMRLTLYRADASHEDYEWQIRVAFDARLGNTPRTVLRHRLHPGQASNRRAKLFRTDLRRYRFAHVYRLYPHTSSAEYQLLAAVAEERRITDPEALAGCGDWLVRLASLPDPNLKRRMVRRWHELCDRAPLAGDDPQRQHFAEKIASSR